MAVAVVPGIAAATPPSAAPFILPTATAQPVTARPVEAQLAPKVNWPEAWGERMLGRSATPMFRLHQTAVASVWRVLGSQGITESLLRVASMQELSRVTLPAQDFSSRFDVTDAVTGLTYVGFLVVTSNVVAFAGKGADGTDHFVWGVHTQGVMTVGVAEQSFGFLFVYGVTATAENAVVAVADGSSVIAQVGVTPVPGCNRNCMAIEGAQHRANLSACLEAAGIVGATGALACVGGCLGTGPGYAACVVACFSTLGIVVGVVGAACIAAYIAAMTGASIGCAVGCWFD